MVVMRILWGNTFPTIFSVKKLCLDHKIFYVTDDVNNDLCEIKEIEQAERKCEIFLLQIAYCHGSGYDKIGKLGGGWDGG